MTEPTDKSTPTKKIVIEGVTDEGNQFRPGDWAERMSGSLCTFSAHRVVYSPLLQPMVKGGNKCVLVDTALKESNPALYEEIMDFARTNKLQVREENGNSNSEKDSEKE